MILLFIIGIIMGTFAWVKGFPYTMRHIGRNWTWAIAGFVVLLCVGLPVAGLLGLAAFDICGVLECRQERRAIENRKNNDA